MKTGHGKMWDMKKMNVEKEMKKKIYASMFGIYLPEIWYYLIFIKIMLSNYKFQ
jgi:hypothetical protein